jgi:hypothetical protein
LYATHNAHKRACSLARAPARSRARTVRTQPTAIVTVVAGGCRPDHAARGGRPGNIRAVSSFRRFRLCPSGRLPSASRLALPREGAPRVFQRAQCRCKAPASLRSRWCVRPSLIGTEVLFTLTGGDRKAVRLVSLVGLHMYPAPWGVTGTNECVACCARWREGGRMSPRPSAAFGVPNQYAVQGIGCQRQMLPCGWTTYDFVGQVRVAVAPRASCGVVRPRCLCLRSGSPFSLSPSCTVSRCALEPARSSGLPLQVALSSGESSRVTITGKVRRPGV